MSIGFNSTNVGGPNGLIRQDARKMKSFSLCTAIALLAIPLLIGPTNLWAQSTSKWDYANGNIWSDSGSWQSGGVPGLGGIAQFDTNASTVASIIESAFTLEQVGAISVLAGDVTLETDSSEGSRVTFDLNNSGANLSVLNSGTTLTLSGLHLNNLGTTMGQAIVDGGGTMTLDGSHSFGTQLDLDGQLLVGFNGSGTVNVNAGSNLFSVYTRLGDSAGSAGTVNVTGAGSIWNNGDLIDVGYGNGTTGVLNILDDAAVSSFRVEVGSQAGSNGALSIKGGSSLVATSLEIGISGAGALNIETGANVYTSYGSVGVNVGGVGEVIITGAGSKWTSQQSLGAGSGADINVSNGGTLVVGNLASSGGVAVGSSFSGHGFLNLADGASLTNDGFAEIGSVTNVFAEASVSNGASWDNLGDMFVTFGSLDIFAGSVANHSGVIGDTRGQGGGFGTVTVEGQNVHSSGSWINRGNLSIGSSDGGIGTLNIGTYGLVSEAGQPPSMAARSTWTVGVSSSVRCRCNIFPISTPIQVRWRET